MTPAVAALVGVAMSVSAVASAVAQDAGAGQRVFGQQCRGCHQVGETAKNLIGPNLNGLFGRKAGTVPDYNYSAANKAAGITWDDAVFAEYIREPTTKIPGTKMEYAGLKSDKQVADVMAYLHQFAADGKRTQ